MAVLPVIVETALRKILDHITEQCLICCDVGVPCGARQACSDPSSLIFPFQVGISSNIIQYMVPVHVDNKTFRVCLYFGSYVFPHFANQLNILFPLPGTLEFHILRDELVTVVVII